MKNFKYLTLFFAFALVFHYGKIEAAGGKDVLVYRSNKSGYKAKTVNLVEGESTVNVPEREYDQFLEELDKYLFVQPKNEPKRVLFKKGEELKIQYVFTGYDEGDKALRSRTFGTAVRGMGKGTITVEVKFFDANGKQVGFIQSKGSVGDASLLGFDAFEKGMRGAVRRCAKGVAEYANKNYLYIPPKTEEQKQKERTGGIKGLKLD